MLLPHKGRAMQQRPSVSTKNRILSRLSGDDAALLKPDSAGTEERLAVRCAGFELMALHAADIQVGSSRRCCVHSAPGIRLVVMMAQHRAVLR